VRRNHSCSVQRNQRPSHGSLRSDRSRRWRANPSPPEQHINIRGATGIFRATPYTAPLAALEVKTGPSIRIGQAAAEAQALEGERKLVTALFADIKGSMELMEDLIPKKPEPLSILRAG